MILAKMTVKSSSEFIRKLENLSNSKEIFTDVVMAGANPIADEIRKNLQKNLANSDYSEGDLEDSLGVAPVDVDKEGNTNTKIGFKGYDSKGVPNALKARAMESGTSTQKKKPFVRPAINKMKKKSIEEMDKKLEEKIKLYGL